MATATLRNANTILSTSTIPSHTGDNVMLRASYGPDDDSITVARKSEVVLTAAEQQAYGGCFFDRHEARTMRSLMQQRYGVRL